MGTRLILEVRKWSSNQFHRESTLKFIAEKCAIPWVVIHLLFGILWGCGSWVGVWFIAMTVKSARVSITIQVLCHKRLLSPPMSNVEMMVWYA